MTDTPPISMIAAVAKNGVIGRNQTLPWHLPDDLRYFKRMTVGKPIIMGRRNFESLGGLLPDRTHIILTRQTQYTATGAVVVHEIEAAFAAARNESPDEIMVIGGSEIYALALPYANRMYLTRIDAEVDGDVYFPTVDWEQWELVQADRHDADARHPYPFQFEVWQRRR